MAAVAPEEAVELGIAGRGEEVGGDPPSPDKRAQSASTSPTSVISTAPKSVISTAVPAGGGSTYYGAGKFGSVVAPEDPVPEEYYVGSDMEEQSTCMRNTKIAISVVFVINIILLIVKIVATIESKSIAVLSSLIDSALDLVSQGILFFVERNANRHDEQKYVVGRTRLEPIGILAMACVMAMTAVEVGRQSIVELTRYASETPKQPFLSFLSCLGPGAAIIAKLGIYFYTRRIEKPITDALADDARNDVLSNGIALIALVVAAKDPRLWWFDQAGALIISIYIIYGWIDTGREQTKKLIGFSATDEQKDIIKLVVSQHTMLELDILRAYHIGRHLQVELEAVMPAETTLRVVHDESLSLQQHVEKLNFVERCFVHIDYECRDYDEHKKAFLV